MSLFLRQLYYELLKLFARKRTYFGFIIFLIVELLILFLLQMPNAHRMFTHSMKQHGLDFSHYFSGLTLAYVMITNTVFVLGSLYLALVCGDIVSKEVEDGTMRMVLSRPVSRARILLLKYVTCIVYTETLVLLGAYFWLLRGWPGPGALRRGHAAPRLRDAHACQSRLHVFVLQYETGLGHSSHALALSGR
jgi:ABC-2 type transport system permease protein